jgi:hypothetical protein
VLRESRTVQGIYETRRFEIQNINSRWENIRVKVIIKQIIGGQKYFWSVIPYWRIDKDNSKRILHNIDHEDD